MTSDYSAQNDRVREVMAELGKEIPGPMSAFAQLHTKVSMDGALSAKVKELIALAIGITVRCNGCIAFHVHDALEAGASRQEIMETIGVAILMGGGPSVVYGAQAMTALREMEAAHTGA
jgi:AhpD family alkylhydroperoxidase